MTRIGLIARADDTGLGHQSWEFHRHMSPTKTLIIDLEGQSASGKDLTAHPERFPGNTTVVFGIPCRGVIEEWLEGLDVLFTMETPYNYEFYSIAREKGIRTVLQANYELLDYLHDGPHQDHLPDILVMPSTWCLPLVKHRLGDRMKVVYLPVPIPTDRWDKPSTDTGSCRRLLHVAGYPAIGDRNGTRNLLDALRYVQSRITVTLTCQRPGYLGSLIQPGQDHGNASLVIDSAPRDNYWDLYADHDVLVLPRRYGGLCLPLNEALGAGLPAIMPDIPPNNDWLPLEWLTSARVGDTVMMKTLVDLYQSDPRDLAAHIDRMVYDEDFYSRCQHQARELSLEYSWDSLIGYYQEVLSS